MKKSRKDEDEKSSLTVGVPLATVDVEAEPGFATEFSDCPPEVSNMIAYIAYI